MFELQADLKFGQIQHYYFLTLQLNWIICPFKSDNSDSFFSACSLLIKSLSGTLLHLCLLHFFISFLSVTTFGSMYRGTVSWKDTSDGNPNQFVRSCLTDSLLALRLKSGVGSGDWQGSWRHYAEIWDRVPALDGRSRPEASQSHPSWGISFCSLMWATCCSGSRRNDQNLARLDRGPSVLSHCYHQQLLSFIDLAGREWLAMFKMEACSPEQCQHWARSNTQACFLCQGRQLKHIPLPTRSWF